jgi:hypothetical protein
MRDRDIPVRYAHLDHIFVKTHQADPIRRAIDLISPTGSNA